MADGREQEVWSIHALDDHTHIEPYHAHVGSIKELLKEIKETNIVWDMGCGSGLWRPIFKDFDYYGVDQNKEMIKIADERDFSYINKVTEFCLSNLRTLNEDAKKLPKPDLIWFSAVLQHNRHEPDKREILETVAKLLSKGKYLMFTETTFTLTNFHPPFTKFEEGCTDNYSFTSKGWIEYVEKFGFKILINEPDNYYLFEKL